MSAPRIIVPSAGRSTRSVLAIPGQILYVPESQAAAYRASNPDQIIETHPDNAHRNLAAKRQAILERYPNVFMLDDDIVFVSRLHADGNNRHSHLTGQEIRDLIHTTHDAARAAGCRLYGFNRSPNPKHYYGFKPIEFTAYINACAFGLIDGGAGLYFTERLTAAESHWINLLNAHLHRRAWCDMRFHFAQEPDSTFKLPGGKTAHRTLATEAADTRFLQRMFGEAVQIRAETNDRKLQHPYQRTLRNPL